MQIFIQVKLFAQDLFRFKVELYDFADLLHFTLHTSLPLKTFREMAFNTAGFFSLVGFVFYHLIENLFTILFFLLSYFVYCILLSFCSIIIILLCF